MKRSMFAAFVLVCLAMPAVAQNTVPVTLDNFIRAESDLYFGNMVKQAGGIGKLSHNREIAPIENQLVIRLNRDTLYSAGVFDLDAGPVTITMPDAGKRFMSMEVVNEDHYALKVIYKPGPVTLSKGVVGTRYVAAAFRTLVDPNDPKDISQARSLQDAIKISPISQGTFEVPNWDPASQKKIRDALLVLAAASLGFSHAFGNKDQVDPIYHLIGTAAGWGGNPERDATYISFTPAKNDGATIYRLNVRNNVPVDGFWSVTVYNAQGYFEKNAFDSYSLNNITAKKGADGAIAIQFGGCDSKIVNCLPVMKDWNYTVRLYRPRAEILSGKWKFPDAQPVPDQRAEQK